MQILANGTERNPCKTTYCTTTIMANREQKNNGLVCTRLVEPPRAHACVFIVLNSSASQNTFAIFEYILKILDNKGGWAALEQRPENHPCENL